MLLRRNVRGIFRPYFPSQAVLNATATLAVDAFDWPPAFIRESDAYSVWGWATSFWDAVWVSTAVDNRSVGAFRLLGVAIWRAPMELGFIFGIAGFALYQLATTASYVVHRATCFVIGVRSRTRSGTCDAFRRSRLLPTPCHLAATAARAIDGCQRKLKLNAECEKRHSVRRFSKALLERR